MAQDNSTGNSGITQQNFVETPYEDASWEVVGELAESDDFIPMEVETIDGAKAVVVDPMFAYYGGFASTGQPKRWHLPEHLSASLRDEQEAEEQDVNRTALTDEEIAAIKAEAFAQGKKEGAEQATLEATKRHAEIEKRMSAMLADLAQQLKENIAQIEQEGVHLALAISKKIVGFAVELNPEYLVPLVNEALGMAGGAAIKKIRVSPEDMEFIEVVGIDKQVKGFDGSWQFEADASIRSGCVLETSAGQVDFQIDAAWERVKENVVKSLA